MYGRGGDVVLQQKGKEMNGTFIPGEGAIEKKWYVVDAEGMTLGRLASGVAAVLRGKNKPEFTPFLDTGDYVIVVNASKIKVQAGSWSRRCMSDILPM